MQIGPVVVEPELVLAPMAGITDHPFRLLVKEQGCGLVFSEMISAKGLVYGGKAYRNLLFLLKRNVPSLFKYLVLIPPSWPRRPGYSKSGAPT